MDSLADLRSYHDLVFGAGTTHTVATAPSGHNFVQVSCSEDHCCALDNMGYPTCWGEVVNNAVNPPTQTFAEFQKRKEVHGWIVKDESQDEEEQSARAARNDQDVGLVQFRQISVAMGLSCGLTLMGAHLMCWGEKYAIRNLPRQAQVGSSN